MVEIEISQTLTPVERMKRKILLIEPPTFPKGVLSLSLSAVAAALPQEFTISVLDLNISSISELPELDEFLFIGVKVSSQNFHLAQEITHEIRQRNGEIKIIWGGEFPTLMPTECIAFCNSVVLGSFEPVCLQIIDDLTHNRLKPSYDGKGKYQLQGLSVPNVIHLYNPSNYYSFMGIPVETSRGCDKKCTFCMVHSMQSKNDFKQYKILEEELAQYGGQFINVIDYNIGVHKEHLIRIAQIFEQSEVLGWMGELCLESLDDDEILVALERSRCKMIYCGLESLDEQSLKSVNKSKTNVLANYERIIRKAQSHGIQIAAGLILGLEGMTHDSFTNTMRQFSEWGIIYTKMTFLTYNPGTKVKNSMRKKGTYLTEEFANYDGNHLSFIANGVDPKEVYSGSVQFIQQFYSLHSIQERAKNAGTTGKDQLEFILFNLAYRNVYMDWLKYDIFTNDESFDELLKKRFVKSRNIKRLEFLLKKVRAEIANLKPA